MTNKHGYKWIRKEKRAAIYRRDGNACVYCGRRTRGGTLTLDHVVPRAEGGSNEATNLITVCFECNSARRDRSIEELEKEGHHGLRERVESYTARKLRRP